MLYTDQISSVYFLISFPVSSTFLLYASVKEKKLDYPLIFRKTKFRETSSTSVKALFNKGIPRRLFRALHPQRCISLTRLVPKQAKIRALYIILYLLVLYIIYLLSVNIVHCGSIQYLKSVCEGGKKEHLNYYFFVYHPALHYHCDFFVLLSDLLFSLFCQPASDFKMVSSSRAR